MKKPQIIIACALVLTLAGLATLRATEEGQKEGKAKVKSVHGKVEYLDNNVWLPVKVNMTFSSGITIRTGPKPECSADISVNGITSAIRLTNNTTLQIPKMSFVGDFREGDSTTMLNLVSGTVLGNVKKISANSRYEIQTPHGVAGIRGTDFKVEAIPTEDGKFLVTFSSITGLITVSAVINGVTVTHTLQSQNEWQIGENPRQISAAVIAADQLQILALVQTALPPSTSIGTPIPQSGIIPPDPHQSDTASGGGG